MKTVPEAVGESTMQRPSLSLVQQACAASPQSLPDWRSPRQGSCGAAVTAPHVCSHDLPALPQQIWYVISSVWFWSEEATPGLSSFSKLSLRYRIDYRWKEQ